MGQVKTVIECTNCGGGGPDLQIWVTLGALAVAGAALVMNYFQFREFMREVHAHAEFDIRLRTVGADDDGVLRTTETRVAVRVEVLAKNVGKKAAGQTLMNVIVPREVDSLRWTGARGEEVKVKGNGTGEEEEPLGHPDGRELPAVWLSAATKRFGKNLTRPAYFQFYVKIPDCGEIVIPVAVKVHAEEIPGEREHYQADHLVRVRRSQPALD
jgi:hypothetical protein